MKTGLAFVLALLFVPMSLRAQDQPSYCTVEARQEWYTIKLNQLPTWGTGSIESAYKLRLYMIQKGRCELDPEMPVCSISVKHGQFILNQGRNVVGKYPKLEEAGELFQQLVGAEFCQAPITES